MTISSRRTFIAGGAALAATTACDTRAQTASITGGTESAFPSADAPGSNDGGYNVLFILTDQEHYMGPGWPIPLPGHERLRRTGTYFENHQIAADMCSASRAVIYTGLHMPHNGIFDNAGVPYMKSLDPSLPTIGKILRRMGYYTAYKGKWHLNGAMAMENRADDIKALFETMMDRDYGFYDYTGVGDFIEGAQGGYQYDQITAAQAIQWLKAKGRPIGQTLGHTFGDAPGFTYPYLWSWGGMEVDPSGKVIMNSKETLESVKFMQAFWKDAHDEGGLAWDDTNNNRAFLSQTISATLNGASIYIETLRKPTQYKTEKGAPMHTDILHSPLPKGPAGQFGFHLLQSHMLMKYSKNQDPAKEFLKWIHTEKNFEKWFVSQKGFATPCTEKWEGHKVWSDDPVMAPFKVAAKLGQAPGHAGPPNAKAAEALSKYIVTDMYAKAVQGMPAEDAVKWADAELKKIYG